VREAADEFDAVVGVAGRAAIEDVVDGAGVGLQVAAELAE